MNKTPSKQQLELHACIRDFRADGMLTPSLRNLFLSKRKKLHFTQAQLSHLLRISTQTIIAWEKGYTQRCSIQHRELVIAFVSGLLPLKKLRKHLL